ncbi:MAG TPA: 16S rRNA (guanine(966)-N(2))-methyltransferase RsmD, partial [Vicinamibacterales bacterium]|nr:16S rRNA (guanine(966)-N(2))-methyltransferase RsmD [Vicinamibacterales bacterium]
VRIISGALKGRRLKAPDWPGLRPTSDKLRETLFNVLGPRVVGASFVDGYAGTGAVGIEALSRGAAFVTFVEHDRRAADLIAANLHHCGVKERYAIIRVDFARARLDRAEGPIDVIFLDPPYGAAEMTRALDAADASAATETLVIVEHAKRDAPPPVRGRLVLTRDLTSGDSGLAFYRVQLSPGR